MKELSPQISQISTDLEMPAAQEMGRSDMGLMLRHAAAFGEAERFARRILELQCPDRYRDLREKLEITPE